MVSLRSRTPFSLRVLAVSALVACATVPWLRGVESATPRYFQITLEDAMFSPANPDDVRELVLDLEQVGDQWSAIYALSRNYNMAYHKGAVKEGKLNGDKLDLTIGTDITPDKWIAGGQGAYNISLTRSADGTLTGNFTGTYNGVKRSGPARGRIYEPVRARDYAPLAPQEHPRLLLRKRDLPALREKAKTPFGRAAMEQIEKAGTPTALGFLYQMTGDKSWAAKAEQEAEFYLAGKKPENSPFVPMMGSWGRLEHLAMVYDLCYDALSADFKARYRAWLGDFGFRVFFAPESMGSNINWHPISNHSANVYSGLALGALALFDEPSAEPRQPTSPFLEETLPPAKDFVPGEGVPVVPLTPGKSPTEWLQTQPLRTTTPEDPREVFYGIEVVNPRPGTGVKVGDFALTFQKMPEANRSAAAHGGLSVGHFLEAPASAKLKEPLTMAIYTVIEVKEPGEYVFQCPVSRANLAQSSLAGKLLADKQVVKLEKGFYPLMTLVQWRMKWGEIAPILTVATPEDATAWKAAAEQLRAQHGTRMEGFAAVLQNWKRSSGGDPMFGRLLRLARFTSTLHCADAVGRGGFQGETSHYHIDASFGHAQLWPIYRRVMGYDLTPDGEYADYLPRKIVGGPQDITGAAAIGDRFFHNLFPVIREEWKPELLTAWHKQAKVADPALPVEVLKPDPVAAFINYPLGMKPAVIGTKLPKVWEASGLGYYALRSGWDDDAFIAQIFVKRQILSGWNGENAGTFRLRGLGQEWATGTTDRYRTREQESVVWLPDAELQDGARGRLTHFQSDANTLVLSINLDEVYETEGRYWFSKFGQLRKIVQPGKATDGSVKAVPPASGITGMRAVAFDFSGESGAPCLFALVDRIDGAKDLKRLWLFQPPRLAGEKQDPKAPPAKLAAAEGRGFRITPQGSAPSLLGTFAYPTEVKVNTEPLTWEYVKTVGTGRGETVKKTISCLSVPGFDHFFFVGTVSAGPHPQVRISGTGLGAVITVGKRTIRFDGEKLVLGRSK